MKLERFGLLAVVVGVLFATAGCQGVLEGPTELGSTDFPDGGPVDDQGPGDTEPRGDRDEPTDTDEVTPEPLPPLVPGPAQLRLLSAAEYRRTVWQLLGVEASPELSHADYGPGYDTGSAVLVEENLFAALLNEGLRIAAVYVSERISADYPCFDSTVAQECVSHIVEHLGRRAFRRPLSFDERLRLESFFLTAVGDVQDRTRGVELLIARILTAPQFLYRTEMGLSGASSGMGEVALGDFEKATLIAYTLTGSTPDDALLDDAEAGRLDEAGIRLHVGRLLQSEAGQTRLLEFFKQWLRVDALDAMVDNPEAFPKLGDPNLGESLRSEFEHYVREVVLEGDGTLDAVLTGNFTYVDELTAGLYGLEAAEPGMHRVQTNPGERRGILTLASVMAAHASAADTSMDRPVARGLLIKNQFLCETVGLPSGVDPAEAAMNVADEFPDFASLTVREQYEAMMEQSEGCKSCHAQFMPYGYTFGSYNALGQSVDERANRPIDTSVQGVPIGQTAESFANAVELIDALAELPIAGECFTRNVIRYVLGTSNSPHVDGLTARLAPAFEEQARNIRLLIEDTLASPDTYLRRRQP